MIDNLLFHCYPLLLSPPGSAFPQRCVPANVLDETYSLLLDRHQTTKRSQRNVDPSTACRRPPRIGQHLVDSRAQSSGTVFHYGCEDWNIYVERPPICQVNSMLHTLRDRDSFMWQVGYHLLGLSVLRTIPNGGDSVITIPIPIVSRGEDFPIVLPSYAALCCCFVFF